MSKVLLQMFSGYKSFGPKVLFDDASFAINEDEHIGLIGPNGAGKSTLVKCLTKELELDSGEIIRSSNLRLGYLAQEQIYSQDTTPVNLWSDLPIPIWELKRLALSLGISEPQFSKKMTELSGGFRMRTQLVRLLGQDPNLILLDEPTNYLDLESVLVLERYLQNFKGAFLLISHDREFLRRTTDHILEVEQGQFTKYNGNIDDYFEQKELLKHQLEKQYSSQQAKRKAILDFASKFGAKATKARQVQSRLKTLDRMEEISLAPSTLSARIRIPEPLPSGKISLEAKKMSLGYNDKIVIEPTDLVLNNGDHIGIVGHNGAGKSTLLKALAKKLTPLSGEVKLGHNVEVSLYAQHVAEDLDPNLTVFESLYQNTHKDTTAQQVKDLAGSLLFSGDDMNKKVQVLSGGEKSRVALGKILLSQHPLILLDEPTNHLDFQTVEGLTQALMGFKGTLVVVSHDRSFIKRVATKILDVNNGQVLLYPGTYDEYVWSKQKGFSANQTENVTYNSSDSTLSSDPIKKKNNKKEINKQFKSLQKDLDKVQIKIKENEKQITQLSESLNQLNSADSQQVAKELYQLNLKASELENEWLAILEEIESLELNNN